MTAWTRQDEAAAPKPPAEAQPVAGAAVEVIEEMRSRMSSRGRLGDGPVYGGELIDWANRLEAALAQDRASQAATPSAPVGVEDVEAALQKWLDWCNEHNEEPEAKSGARIAIEALAQQPAAVDGAMVEEANEQAAIAAYEKFMGVSADDPAYGPDLSQWMAGWNAALAGQQGGTQE